MAPRREGYRHASDDHPFSSAVRVLACDGCGDAREVGTGAAQATCSACGADMALASAVDPRVAPSPARPEAERLARLQKQTTEVIAFHPEALPFTNMLDEDLPAARALYGRARRKLLADPEDLEAEQLVVSLLFEISNKLSAMRRPAVERRALTESTLEALRTNKFRQMCLGDLARGAAYTDDLASARDWLGRMDPQSDDLLADTGYRTAAATIATAEGRFDDVLELLGKQGGDVPIHMAQRGLAVAYRANAHEKLGFHVAAERELSEHARGSSGALTTLRAVCRNANPAWTLCRHAIAAATGEELARNSSHLAQGRDNTAVTSACLLVTATVLARGQGFSLLLAIPCALATTAAVAAGLHFRRKAQRIARGSIAVRGRVLEAARRGAQQAAMRVLVEPIDASIEPQEIATVQVLPKSLPPDDMQGRSFSGFWNHRVRPHDLRGHLRRRPLRRGSVTEAGAR